MVSFFFLFLAANIATETIGHASTATSSDVFRCCAKPHCRCARRFESRNFAVRSEVSAWRAGDIGGDSEAFRNEQRIAWLGEDDDMGWEPRCEVVVHASEGAYLSAVGAQARGTSGCSLLQTHQGRVVARRIDLLGTDVARARSALAHELTHVVLADRFVVRGLPRWADEGIATLSDSIEKQIGHHHDLLRAVSVGTDFRLGELLHSEDYPAPHRLGTFYGQSSSLVRFLKHRGGATTFVRFMEQSQRSGYDQGLRDVYGIAGVGELERLWHRYAQSSDAAPTSVKSTSVTSVER